MNYCFVFCHGWGFDHNFLKPLANGYFSKFPCYFLNLGYFGEENLLLPEKKDSLFIGIGHSFGLIKLASLKVNFKALIGIGAFSNFLGFDAALHQKRTLELRVMMGNFQKNPLETLLFFYRRCGFRLENLNFFNQLNKPNLAQDLERIAESYELPQLPMLILGAANDLIVPQAIIYDNFTKKEKIIIHSKGSHSLGLKERYFVYEQTMNFLNEAKILPRTKQLL